MNRTRKNSDYDQPVEQGEFIGKYLLINIFVMKYLYME
jgi:hypothetical protein